MNHLSMSRIALAKLALALAAAGLSLNAFAVHKTYTFSGYAAVGVDFDSGGKAYRAGITNLSSHDEYGYATTPNVWYSIPSTGKPVSPKLSGTSKEFLLEDRPKSTDIRLRNSVNGATVHIARCTSSGCRKIQ